MLGLQSFEGNGKICALAHDHFYFLWPFLKFAFFMPQCIKFIFINLLTAHTTPNTKWDTSKSQSTDRSKNVKIGNENEKK